KQAQNGYVNDHVGDHARTAKADATNNDGKAKHHPKKGDDEIRQGFHRISFLPNRPLGQMMSTTAIIKNTRPSTNNGNPRLPNERTKPISMAETKAPMIEPSPPMTVTMNDSMRMEKPMPEVSDRTGAASA